MHVPKRHERGFTLIEVTLAIVIGVVVIGGATLLYQQASRAAGNARAQTKTAALATLVEEMAARTGKYPTHEQLRKSWGRLREDALLSPWGGSLGANGLGSVEGIAMSNEAFTTPWTRDSYANIDYAGVLGYMVATNATDIKPVTDYPTEITRHYRYFVVAIWDPDGNAPCFPAGPNISVP